MPHRTLIITVGQTPQVVTETVYALLKAPNPWIPNKILLATTRLAADLFASGSADRGLDPLVGAEGRLRLMYQELDLADSYVEPEVHPSCFPSGAYIDDVRSAPQVSAFANTLLRLVRVETADEQTEVHLSLAGGRKTMSYLAGQVMSIYGRSRDVLSHVLVEPAQFETQAAARFWWPGQKDPTPVVDREGQPTGRFLDTTTAHVLLHGVPFIRLRAYLPSDELFHGDIDYDSAVARANDALAIDRLVINLDSKTPSIRVGPYTQRLDPKMAALFAVIAHAKKNGVVLRSTGQADLRQLTFDKSVDQFINIWANILAGIRARELLISDPSAYEGKFNEELRVLKRDFNFKGDVGVPVSRLRQSFKDFPKFLADKVLSKRNLETGFPASGIEIIHPSGLVI
jgi:CRISPR-associated protein (TIGR02584 family)